MVPTGLGNNDTGYDLSVLGVAKDAVKSSDAQEDIGTSEGGDDRVGRDADETLSDGGLPDVSEVLKKVEAQIQWVEIYTDERLVDEEASSDGHNDNDDKNNDSSVGKKRPAAKLSIDRIKPKNKAPRLAKSNPAAIQPATRKPKSGTNQMAAVIAKEAKTVQKMINLKKQKVSSRNECNIV